MNFTQLPSYEKFKNDQAFMKISKDLITNDRQHIQETNPILTGIISNKIVQYMRLADSSFDQMYDGIIHGESFHKGLKMSKPNEYEFNLVINLPVEYSQLKIEPHRSTPEHAKIQVLNRRTLGHQPFWDQILTRDYLDQNKFRRWLQNVFDGALSRFRQTDNENKYVIKCRRKKSTYEVEYNQSSPTFSINVKRVDCEERNMKFDLIPCLLFRDNRSIPGFRPHSENWIAVAKPLNREDVKKKHRSLWRIGFYGDEKKLFCGQVKPVIRMMKKLRDINEWHQLKSYFIETLFLHELENAHFADDCTKVSKTNILMHMLGLLQKKLADGVLNSYWHTGRNILDDIPKLKNIAKDLQTIVSRIDNEIRDDHDILLRIFKLI